MGVFRGVQGVFLKKGPTRWF